MDFLLADAGESLGGTTGWVGTGILGAVLSWLMFIHLPAKDKQLKELLESKDGLIQGMIDRHNANMRDVSVDFKNALEHVTAHCEKEISRLMESWQRDMSQLTKAIHDLAISFEGAQQKHAKGDQS